MRKIITIEEREKKEQRNKIIIGLILVGIMVLSTAGYAFFSNKEEIKQIKYKNIEFSLKDDGLWHFSIEQQEFATAYNPEEIENISVGNLNLQNYFNNVLYFSYDSNREAINEISRNIGRFATRIQLACMEECEADLPVKNCSDNIIIIKESSESLIKQEEKCIYILASQEDIIKASDSLIFKFLNI